MDIELTDHSLILDTAKAAREKGNFTGALLLWEKYREQDPLDPVGYAEPARILCKLQRFEEADDLLSSGLNFCSSSLLLKIEYAWVAHHQGNFVTALERWAVVNVEFPNHPAGSVGIGRILLQTRELEKAEKHLAIATVKFPKDIHLAETYARVVGARENWVEALSRWDVLATLQPLDTSALRERGLCFWQVQMQAHIPKKSTALKHPNGGPVEIGRVSNPQALELVKKFESIGENCEFGLVQRRFEAEPIDLLRWTGIGPEKLLHLLEAQCAGLGDKNNLALSRTSWGEYIVHDTKFGIGFHTFLTAEIANESRFLSHQSTRIRWLRKVLLDSLTAARKTFVYKVHHGASELQMNRIFNVLKTYGSNRLLWVKAADSDNVAGTVTQLEHGLIQGYLSYLNPSDQEVWDIPFDEWLSICGQAEKLVANEKSLF